MLELGLEKYIFMGAVNREVSDNSSQYFYALGVLMGVAAHTRLTGWQAQIKGRTPLGRQIVLTTNDKIEIKRSAGSSLS